MLKREMSQLQIAVLKLSGIRIYHAQRALEQPLCSGLSQGNCTSIRRILDCKSSLNGVVVSHVGGDVSMVPPVRVDCVCVIGDPSLAIQCGENHAEGKIG